MRVYDKSGAPVSPTISFNEFFGYPPAIDRTTGTFGAFHHRPGVPLRPSVRALLPGGAHLDQDPTSGDFTGKNRLDLAVSTTSEPDRGVEADYPARAERRDGRYAGPQLRRRPDPAARRHQPVGVHR
jgi:hypothetical protein